MNAGPFEHVSRTDPCPDALITYNAKCHTEQIGEKGWTFLSYTTRPVGADVPFEEAAEQSVAFALNQDSLKHCDWEEHIRFVHAPTGKKAWSWYIYRFSDGSKITKAIDLGSS
jgi:hypothetical protein